MTQAPRGRPTWATLAALVAIAFGALTVASGGRVLFGPAASRAAAGSYVPFVLWFNVCAGAFYVAAGAGLWRGRRWAVWLALAIAVATALVFAALGAYLAAGGVSEPRTVAAMAFRLAVWVVIGALAWRWAP